MKIGKPLLILIVFTSILLPVVYGATFIGSVNYIATHGGIVHFSQTFTAYRLNYALGLNFFTQVVWGGNPRGNLGFDADTDVNMTVTGIAQNRVTYTVEALDSESPVNTYLYYRRNVGLNPLSTPAEVIGGTWVYNQGSGILTVTTTGNPVLVTVTYGSGVSVSPSFINANSILIALMPLFVLLIALSDIKEGTFGAGTIGKSIMMIIVLGIMGWIIQGWGY